MMDPFISSSDKALETAVIVMTEAESSDNFSYWCSLVEPPPPTDRRDQGEDNARHLACCRLSSSLPT